MSKILFADIFFGTPRGHSYVNNDLIKLLKEDGHDVAICKSNNNKIMSEFIIPDKIFENTETTLEMSEVQFRKVLEEYKPDYCIFNEYGQWGEISYDKLDICKEQNIKTIGYIIWERFEELKKEHYKKYDKLICPSGFQTKFLRKKGLFNTVHIKWGVDLEEINSVVAPTDSGKTIFYHCAGGGGVDNRKNTKKVIEAYKLIKDDTTDLQITHLGSQVFSKSEIYSFMKNADVLVNPSKWETIGIPALEANACGIPVITTNAPPMNEFVLENVNGLLVDGEVVVGQHVTCDSVDVSVKALADKMRICKNKLVLDTLKSNAKEFAKTNFDWNKNKIDFLKLFKED